MPITANDIITFYGLEPLPGEGGFFRQSYRSADVLPPEVLQGRYSEPRLLASGIYYLLTPDTCSRLHRLPTDEIYHFYLGDPVTLLRLFPDGTSNAVTLGQNIRKGEHVQFVVPKGVWQGSFLNEGGVFAFMGTTMAPGFEYSDFEAGDRDFLTNAYPEREAIIRRLTV